MMALFLFTECPGDQTFWIFKHDAADMGGDVITLGGTKTPFYRNSVYE